MTTTTHPASAIAEFAGYVDGQPAVTWLDRDNMPSVGTKLFTQAAANKAAEEVGLPMKVREAFEDRHEGYEFPSESLKSGAFGEYMAGWRAADRASRQVANKAEVEGIASSEIPDGWPTEIWLNAGDEKLAPFSEYDELSWCSLPQGENDIRYVREDLLANPPATTGASTVLTDERISEAMDRARLNTDSHCESLASEPSKEYSDAYFFQQIQREVAAQAGQVTVPDVDLLRSSLKDIRDYRTDVSAKIASDSMRFIAELALQDTAPSPAKESK